MHTFYKYFDNLEDTGMVKVSRAIGKAKLYKIDRSNWMVKTITEFEAVNADSRAGRRKDEKTHRDYVNLKYTQNLIEGSSITFIQMTGKASSCGLCGQYFESKVELRKHIDREHRITNAKPAGQFLLTCKSCKKIFASAISISSKGRDLDMLVTGNKETCPNCHQIAVYHHEDYTFI